MKFIIKNRFTGKVIHEGEAESFREFVEKNKTDLREADFMEADLMGADLREANLIGADLWGADLRGAKINKNQIADLLKAIGVIVK